LHTPRKQKLLRNKVEEGGSITLVTKVEEIKSEEMEH